MQDFIIVSYGFCQNALKLRRMFLQASWKTNSHTTGSIQVRQGNFPGMVVEFVSSEEIVQIEEEVLAERFK